MTYHNILVVVDQTAPSRLRVQAAVDIARRFEASLTGVCLRAEQIPAFVAGDAVSAVTAVDFFLEERTRLITLSASAARKLFETATHEAGIPCRWLEIAGDNPSELTRCARHHDLSILPASMPVAGGVSALEATSVAMAAGGPVLILPDLGYTPAFGDKILVGWKDSREASRALRDAWPFLTGAKEVTFLSVGKEAEAGFDEIQLQNLEAHGCKTAKMIADRNDERDVGDAIRINAGIVGANMLVIGLYGHSRVQELLLGGVSRDLLSHVPMPVLVSH